MIRDVTDATSEAMDLASGPIARFSGKIIRVDFDSAPDLHPDHDDQHADAKVTHALLRQ